MTIIEHPVPHYTRTVRKLIDAIVIHDTGARTASSTLSWFRDPRSMVSSHYLIDRDGTVYRCVPDSFSAWHAGMSQLHGNEDVNDFSIGIELVDATNYNDPYPLEQLATLTRLCAHLCYTYRIQINRIVGHADIVMPHGRKIDPGADFPWYDFLREVVHYTGE